MAQFPGCPVDMLQNTREFHELLTEVFHRAPKRILEIGSMNGATLWAWARLKPEKLCSIDLCVSPADPRYGTQQEGHNGVWKEWAKDSDFLVINGMSQDPEVLKQVKGFSDKFDFAFIDGDHEYDSVKADYENILPLIAQGGMIAFHDISAFGVKVLWPEIQKIHLNREHYLVPGNFGIGVIYVD